MESVQVQGGKRFLTFSCKGESLCRIPPQIASVRLVAYRVGAGPALRPGPLRVMAAAIRSGAGTGLLRAEPAQVNSAPYA